MSMIISDPQFHDLKIPTGIYDVFISHAGEDTAWCVKLVKRLEKHGLKVWFDQSQMRGAGGTLADAINDGLAKSRRVVLVMTPDYFAKDWAQAEAAFAVNQDPSGRRQFVIPILRKDCEIPPLLRSLRYVDFRDSQLFNENCRLLAEALRAQNNGEKLHRAEKLETSASQVEAEPQSRRVETPRVARARKWRYLRIASVTFFLSGLGGLLAGQFFSRPAAPPPIKPIDLELSPALAGLVQINSMAELKQSLAQIKPRLPNVMRKSGAGGIVRSDNCFEIGVAGNTIKYFAMQIYQGAFDLKSRRFLLDEERASPAVEKHVLLLHFMQTPMILEQQSQQVKDALKEAANFRVETDGVSLFTSLAFRFDWLKLALLIAGIALFTFDRMWQKRASIV
jgi:hypothetical protein